MKSEWTPVNVNRGQTWGQTEGQTQGRTVGLTLGLTPKPNP